MDDEKGGIEVENVFAIRTMPQIVPRLEIEMSIFCFHPPDKSVLNLFL